MISRPEIGPERESELELCLTAEMQNIISEWNVISGSTDRQRSEIRGLRLVIRITISFVPHAIYIWINVQNHCSSHQPHYVTHILPKKQSFIALFLCSFILWRKRICYLLVLVLAIFCLVCLICFCVRCAVKQIWYILW